MRAGCTGCHPNCFWVRVLKVGLSSDTKKAEVLARVLDGDADDRLVSTGGR
jgi:hypothetical protein